MKSPLAIASELRRLADSVTPDTLEQRFEEMVDLAASFVLHTLEGGAPASQVALLMLTAERSHLVFVYPPRLAGGNAFPVNNRSVAGRAIAQGSPLIDNAVKKGSHYGFYERVGNVSGISKPIHKMIATPMRTVTGEIVAVAELSRCGDEPDASGPDFLPEAAERLRMLCDTLAPHLDRVWRAHRRCSSTPKK
ncbi:MAG: GAF domain-containing protein [Candidatus Schekmanbacteria bacterium]|nr:GAF domain-containing protein [Candidatus Schekmanbacteria bacterium]